MHRGWKVVVAVAALVVMGMTAGVLGMQVQGAKADPPASSYLSVNEDDFRTIFSKMSGAKAQVMKRQMELLGARYDLGDRPAAGVTMSRGKPIQDGVRVKLPAGATWEALEKMSPAEIREAVAASEPSPKAAWSFPASSSTRSRSRRAGT